MAPCSAHAYASEEQEEIYQEEKTFKERFRRIVKIMHRKLGYPR
jgi:hypothetical protein|tara:strand:+ start:426 stop:557 length:132 start_codon:yes stop_codon:yes gene_type:complete